MLILDPFIREVLILRRDGGGSSSKKWRAIKQRLSADGYDSLQSDFHVRQSIRITRTTVQKRWSAHVAYANKNRKPHPLRAAIRKYGGDSFALEIMADGLTEDEAKSLEVFCIDTWQLRDRIQRVRGR